MLHRILLIVLFCVVGVGFSQQRVCDDVTPRVAVISAFAPEMTLLLERTEIEGECVVNGRTFTYGSLEGNDVVLFLSGISMVNAAMTTQLGIDHFAVTHILVSGIAGGVNPELNIGDVTIPAQWGQYQEQLFAREAADELELGGRDDPFGNYGMMVPQYVDVTRAGADPDLAEEVFWFPVDDDMLEVASRAASEVTLEACTPDDVCLDDDPQVVVGGNGVSGSTFVDNAEYRAWVFGTFDADALEMETAAVAHVAYANDVPYIAFRSLSDLAGGGPGENEIGTFFQFAANNSALLVFEFLDEWSEETR